MNNALKTSRRMRVYHVGFLARGPLTAYDAAQRDGRAYEGPGLSVSMTPRAWIRIAKLGGRPVWMLTRRDGRPGLFAIWSGSLQAKANSFGLKNGLLQKVKVYRVWSYDFGDDDNEGYITCGTEAEAQGEVEGCSEARIEEATDYVPPGGKVADATWAQADVLGRYLAQRPGDYDGIWWNETYDPDGLSAPRGVILPHVVTRWAATPSDFIEDEWEGA